jgi:hypothetical protein
MAKLRLIIVALGNALLVACSSAEAQPPDISGLTTPSGWQSLPALATAVSTAAKATGVTITGSEAWGEPAIGCYAMWIALRGTGTTVAQVFKGLDAAGIVPKDFIKPTTEYGQISLSFERGEHRGRLRVHTGDGRLSAIACFANAREPASCEAGCKSLLGASR